MNNEIEDILKYLANDNTDYEEEGHTYKILELDECELLLNYIAGLQRKEYNNSKAIEILKDTNVNMPEINITFPGQILDYVDTKEHLLELYKYITNLQEENNKLKNKINQLQEDLTDTEKEWSYWEDRCDEEEERLNKLIDNLELKGDDKDANI